MSVQSLKISDNLLITGGDDPLLPQLLHAINHATNIEIAVSFIQLFGLDLLLPSIYEAIEIKASYLRPLRLKTHTQCH